MTNDGALQITSDIWQEDTIMSDIWVGPTSTDIDLFSIDGRVASILLGRNLLDTNGGT